MFLKIDSQKSLNRTFVWEGFAAARGNYGVAI
jgi:hypothetical protein